MKYLKSINENFKLNETVVYNNNTYIKFDEKEDTLDVGDVFYKFDPDIKDLPPIKLTVTNWAKKCFDEGDKYSQFEQTFPKSVMDEWKKEYGTTTRKWKKFLKNELNNKSWYFFDDLYILQ
tara:strand:- start:56 stop:418 length:363 start_codon:yes stop_codon:yes gene_type:complete